ncbi:MAG: IS21-like element helper ATPase IstB [Sphaerochaetaceae bacterium]
MKASIQDLQSLLLGFGLKHAAAHMDPLIETAEAEEWTYRQFLQELLQTEVTGRNLKRMRRNMTGAHFPAEKSLEDFETKYIEGISPTQIAQLRELAWADAHMNILLFGPPGVGKTHLAIALGIEAVKAGYTVCFERMDLLAQMLVNADTQRKDAFRIKRIKEADVIIIDEIGYVPITRDQATRFFTLLSSIYEHSTLITTSNLPVGQWSEVLGDPVLTGALLDRMLHHSRCFSINSVDGESYRQRKQVAQKKSQRD